MNNGLTIAAFVISCVSFVFSCISLFQDYKIKKHQIKKDKEEDEEKKHAKIKMASIKGLRNYMVIRIQNVGKCAARDLKIEVLNEAAKQDANVACFTQEVPSFLAAGDAVDLGFQCYLIDDYVKFNVDLEDDSGTWNNEISILRNCSHD